MISTLKSLLDRGKEKNIEQPKQDAPESKILPCFNIVEMIKYVNSPEVQERVNKKWQEWEESEDGMRTLQVIEEDFRRKWRLGL